MAESIKLKAILHLMKLRVLLYGWSYFSEMRPVSLLNATVADGLHPPLVDRTRSLVVQGCPVVFICHVTECGRYFKANGKPVGVPIVLVVHSLLPISIPNLPFSIPYYLSVMGTNCSDFG